MVGVCEVGVPDRSVEVGDLISVFPVTGKRGFAVGYYDGGDGDGEDEGVTPRGERSASYV